MSAAMNLCCQEVTNVYQCNHADMQLQEAIESTGKEAYHQASNLCQHSVFA